MGVSATSFYSALEIPEKFMTMCPKSKNKHIKPLVKCAINSIITANDKANVTSYASY